MEPDRRVLLIAMTSLDLEGGQDALGQQFPKPVLGATSGVKQMSTDHLGNCGLIKVKSHLLLLLLLVGSFVIF